MSGLEQQTAHTQSAVSYGPAYLQGLNAPQREAVENLDGPLLMLAGAGTGKTRALTARLAHLLMTGHATPGQILAVTFTNKAAREMRERVARLIGRPTEGWWLGTFHSLAARILRAHAEQVGLKSTFTILDSDDQIRLVKQVLAAMDVDQKRWPARLVHSVIDRWKDKGLAPDALKPADAGDVLGGRMLEAYTTYQNRLKTLNCCDFGDLLLHNLAIFTKNPEILSLYHQRFSHLLVDEYQDTNVAQYLWLRLLAQASHNLCCVGDDDQSIYGWRGAEVGNILRFETDFPGAKIIRLEQNYRSTGNILAAASGLIAHNRGRLGKTLFTEAEGGDPIIVEMVWDGEEEARQIGDRIEDLRRAKVPHSEMAILVRAGFQMREIEDRLITLGLPYRVIGGPRFYERAEIRDAVAYLRIIAQPADDLAFERIINTPRRGIGKATLQSIHLLARSNQTPLTQAAEVLVETDELTTRARNALSALLKDLTRWRKTAIEAPHPDLAQIVLDESGYTAMLQADKSPEAAGRLENLKELVAGMEEFESLDGFLEHVALVTEAETAEPGDTVFLMTLHAAKGLEFEHVFLPGWEEGVFPNQRALDESGVAGLEEERRLAYVGLTRARKRAYVFSAANRRVHGQWVNALPSRFVDELPGETVDTINRLSDEAGMAPVSGFEAARAQFLSREPAFAARAMVIDGTARRVQPRARPSSAFSVEDRIFHQKFGYGTVRSVDNDKLTIDFDHSGEKRVMDSFVVAAKDAG